MRIGIDLGGTKISGGMVDSGGRVFARRKIPTGSGAGYKEIAEKIVGLIRDIIGEAGQQEGVERIGIAAAGQIEKGSQKIIFSPNLGFHNVPLKDDIERALGITTCIENDVNAATYGEWRFGLGGAPANVLGVFVGTGIGGGLILDGRLFRGFSNVGGEIGHMTVNPHGYWCNCGNQGCFEAYCGGTYLIERVRKRLGDGWRGKIWDLVGGDPGALNAGYIEEAWLEGDPICTALWEEAIEYMGVGLASLVNILNPEMIIFGGGVVFGSRYLIERAEAVMRKRAMAASLTGLTLERARLGDDAAIVGAAFVEG